LGLSDFGVLITIAVATGGAWLHQVLVRRFTFALFRLYVTVVLPGLVACSVGASAGGCYRRKLPGMFSHGGYPAC
jgi:hypothetical protein